MNHRIGIALIVAIGLSCLVCTSLTLNRLTDDGVQPAEALRNKRHVPHSAQELQEMLTKVKRNCIRKLDFPESIADKKLIYESHPTQKEKGLIECILKGAKLMEEKSNKLSTERITQLAAMISNKNELIVAIAAATAENCNRRLNAKHSSEAAYQISKCLARELTAHRVKLFF